MQIASLVLFLVAAHQTPLDARAIYKTALPSIMTVSSTTKNGEHFVGTAFLAIKDGIAVTAWHVVKDATTVSARFSDGQEFEVSGLIDKDEKRDVAIIRVKVADRPLLEFQTMDPETGSKCFLIGAPGGLEFSISDGIISQVRQFEGTKQLQYTCAQNPGNSGGPLLDERGKVLGIADWHLRDSQGLNFAISASYAKGLDSTLPTTPWGSIPSTKSPADTRANVDLTDLATKISRIRLQAGTAFMAAYDLDLEISTISPRNITVPGSVQVAIDDLTDLSKQLGELQVPNDDWKGAVKDASRLYQRVALGLEDMLTATKAAMGAGWTGNCKTLLQQG